LGVRNFDERAKVEVLLFDSERAWLSKVDGFGAEARANWIWVSVAKAQDAEFGLAWRSANHRPEAVAGGDGDLLQVAFEA
jgi:hypothetical protein